MEQTGVIRGIMTDKGRKTGNIKELRKIKANKRVFLALILKWLV